jgi:flagellar motor switch protein FliN/FliY
VTERDLVRALLEELGGVAAAMVGGQPVIRPEGPCDSRVWTLQFDVVGSVSGEAVLAVPAEDAARLAGLVMGFDTPPDDEIVTDSLQEMAQQVASAITVKHGPSLKVTSPSPVASGSAPPSTDWCVIVLDDLRTRVGSWHTLTARVAAPAPAPPRPTPAPPRAAAPIAAPAVPGNLDLILDIELPLWVRFGQTAMSLQALTKVGPGTTLDLERSPDDPVDVMVNNTVIARGEVVVVAGNYGVRVTEVVSTTDRIRSMAG